MARLAASYQLAAGAEVRARLVASATPTNTRSQLGATKLRGSSSGAGCAAPGYDAPQEVVMTVRVVRLGSPRVADEGLRIGTVRRPPRGVPASRFAAEDWYDVWYPNLAPSLETMKAGRAAVTEKQWAAFRRRYRAEMAAPDASRSLDVLAALSRTADFSVGCYCEDESRCHRSVLRDLLAARGAKLA